MAHWIGVDLDGTLAHYDGWGDGSIGRPIPQMAMRVHKWLEQGKTVKIFTARASDPEEIPRIKAWLLDHGFGDLEITNVKDYRMIELWDDRAIQVEPNTGRRLDGKR
jgi:hypothetical protein